MVGFHNLGILSPGMLGLGHRGAEKGSTFMARGNLHEGKQHSGSHLVVINKREQSHIYHDKSFLGGEDFHVFFLASKAKLFLKLQPPCKVFSNSVGPSHVQALFGNHQTVHSASTHRPHWCWLGGGQADTKEDVSLCAQKKIALVAVALYDARGD